MSKKVKRSKKRLVRGVIYRMTPKGIKMLAEITGQGKIVKSVLKAMRQANAAQLQKRIGKRLKTRKPGNVMASYLTKWRQRGFVAVKLPKKVKA